MSKKNSLDCISPTRRGFILVKENDPEAIIADSLSGGMLLYSNYNEAEAWAKQVATNLGLTIIIEPIDIMWFTPNKKEEVIN